MLKKILIVTLALVLTACKTTPVKNISSEYIPTQVNGEYLTQTQIQQAIVAAAQKKKWRPRIIKPGLIMASLNVRSHSATVLIPYTEKSYSIEYKNSDNLKYNDGNIHKSYNRWVSSLAREIENQLEIRAFYKDNQVSE